MSAMSRSSRPENFDAKGVDQHQTGEARGRTHHDLGRNPAAKTGADQHRIVQPKLGREIEIEISEVVDHTHAVEQRRVTPTRMPRCEHSVTAGEEFEPQPLRRQPLAGMQKHQRPALAAFDQLEGSSGDRQHLAHRGIIAETYWGFQAGLERVCHTVAGAASPFADRATRQRPHAASAARHCRNTTKIAVSP